MNLSLPVFKTQEHPCPYLPGNYASELVVGSRGLDSAMYEKLMHQGFRRSGVMFYATDCPGCQACVPIRVPVDQFRLSKSQKRALNKNRDVEVRVLSEPLCDEARHELLCRYETFKHGGKNVPSFDEFEANFCFSTIHTIEMDYLIDGKLIGVGLVDVCPDSLSSVYFYFEPEYAKRSLGIFSALTEIQETGRRGLRYWHMGFVVRGCAKMDYKNTFRPHEVRDSLGFWSVPHARRKLNPRLGS